MRPNHAAVIGFALGMICTVLMYETRPKGAQSATSGFDEPAVSTDVQTNEPIGTIGDPS